ncbi:MAG: hypothetical protein Q9181_007652 [Wetmoreana brouardii]
MNANRLKMADEIPIDPRLLVDTPPPRKEVRVGKDGRRMVVLGDQEEKLSTQYHKDTRILVPGGEAGPYKDLPDDEYYAPGLSMQWYKAKCSKYCGKVIPAKGATSKGEPPQQPRKQRPLVGKAVMHCVICGVGYGAYKQNAWHVESHFPTCVERNGNPKGYHVSFELSIGERTGLILSQWFDDPGVLAHYQRVRRTNKLSYNENRRESGFKNRTRFMRNGKERVRVPITERSAFDAWFYDSKNSGRQGKTSLRQHSHPSIMAMAALEQDRPPTPMDYEESGRIFATETESTEEVLQILLNDVKNRYERAEHHFKGQADKIIEEQVDSMLREHAASLQLAKGVETAFEPSTEQGHSPAAVPLSSVNMGMSGSPAASTQPSANHISSPAGASRPSVHEGETQADHTGSSKGDEYAPGIPWVLYNRIRTKDCGVVKAPPTANHVIKPPPQFGNNNPRPFKCAICDCTFTQRRHVKDHFQYCVARNGNPDGRHWFDSPSILVTYRPDWKGTVAINKRYNHDDKAKGDVPKQKLDRKVVQGSGKANEQAMPMCFIPEGEWVAYQKWRRGFGDKNL